MEEQEVNRLISLTTEQKKAFTSLKRAYKKCLSTGIYFSQTLNSLEAYNGNNVECVDDDPDNGFLTQYLDIDYTHITDAWADDNHYVHFK